MKYFAYGSNMTTSRLENRVGGVVDLGVFVLDDYDFNFNQIADDGSGYATIAAKKGAIVEGVLYELSNEQMKVLDRYEGTSTRDYERIKVKIHNTKDMINAITYIACKESVKERLKPRKDYLSFLIKGGQEPTHRLSEKYIKFLKSLKTFD